jgi:hypothetical protein
MRTRLSISCTTPSATIWFSLSSASPLDADRGEVECSAEIGAEKRGGLLRYLPDCLGERAKRVRLGQSLAQAALVGVAERRLRHAVIELRQLRRGLVGVDAAEQHEQGGGIRRDRAAQLSDEVVR